MNMISAEELYNASKELVNIDFCISLVWNMLLDMQDPVNVYDNVEVDVYKWYGIKKEKRYMPVSESILIRLSSGKRYEITHYIYQNKPNVYQVRESCNELLSYEAKKEFLIDVIGYIYDTANGFNKSLIELEKINNIF